VSKRAFGRTFPKLRPGCSERGIEGETTRLDAGEPPVVDTVGPLERPGAAIATRRVGNTPGSPDARRGRGLRGDTRVSPTACAGCDLGPEGASRKCFEKIMALTTGVAGGCCRAHVRLYPGQRYGDRAGILH